jgi:hypothetical protein
LSVTFTNIFDASSDVKLEDAERVSEAIENSLDKSVPGLNFSERVEIRKGIALLRKIPELQQRISDLEQYIRERV